MLGATANSAIFSYSERVCKKYYERQYSSRGLHKAIATIGGVAFCTPSISFGVAYEEKSVKAAVEAALRACRAEAKRAKNTGTCKIIEAK